MSYLDDYAEQNNQFKVVMYHDHYPKDKRYFNDYSLAYKYYKSRVGELTDARFTSACAIIKVATGEPIVRESWRIYI